MQRLAEASKPLSERLKMASEVCKARLAEATAVENRDSLFQLVKEAGRNGSLVLLMFIKLHDDFNLPAARLLKHAYCTLKRKRFTHRAASLASLPC